MDQARISLPSPAVSATRWRTLIVDDHPLFRQGLQGILRLDPEIEVCGEAGNAAEAWEQFCKTGANFVTVDISLGGGNGLDLVRRMKAARPEVMVLVVSMHDEIVYAKCALEAGAAGYVCKHAASDEICTALRVLRKGSVYVSDEILKHLLQS
ncbi:MAG TPA: response regulator transcription factor, partial [Pirellulales bacterium]|nr:response regulator transcription factor [Pirellulales bacterium]